MRVVVAFVERDGVARLGRHVVRALLQSSAVEDRRGAVIPARMARYVQRETLTRRQRELHADVAVVEAAHRVLARRRGAVRARPRKRVVDVVLAVLDQRRHADRQQVLDQRPTDTRVEADAVERSDRGGCAALEVVGRLVRIELDDAGSGIAAEQRALRTAQHFDLADVEHRVRFQHDMLEDHVVLDDRDRLRGAEVEIDVAEAADVEAREDAAGRRFDVQPGDAPRQREQRIVAACGEGAERVTRCDADRERHFLEVFRPALGGDDDVVQTFLGTSLPCRILRLILNRCRLRERGRATHNRTERDAEHQRRLNDRNLHDDIPQWCSAVPDERPHIPIRNAAARHRSSSPDGTTTPRDAHSPIRRLGGDCVGMMTVGCRAFRLAPVSKTVRYFCRWQGAEAPC